MLAADSWAFEPLVDACARVLDARPGWLWPLVDLVLDSYRRAPHDSARALTGLIAGSGHLARAMETARREGTELRIAHLESTPAVMLRGQRDIPRIHGLAQLADFLDVTAGQLDWLSDTAHWNRRTRPGRLHHYSYSWITRPGRAPRLLEVPNRRMRTAQRTILREILNQLPLHPAVDALQQRGLVRGIDGALHVHVVHVDVLVRCGESQSALAPESRTALPHLVISALM
jgi:hypothetical protein